MKTLKDVEISVLDLAPVRDGGTPAEAFKNSVALARHVEPLGYKRFWLAEHHNMPGIASSATSILIGHIAAATKTLRVGSGGIMLPNHAPLVIAEQFGTLEALHPGRIDLGLGRAPGTDPNTSYALRRGLEQSGNDFPELLAELMRYLEPADRSRRVNAYPGNGMEIPIWLLGSSLFSARLAAELGLPFAFASHFAPEQLIDAIEIYRRKFIPSRTLDKPYVAVGVPVYAAPTDDEAKHLSTTAMQKFLALIRGNPIQGRPPVADMESIWSYSEKISVMSRLAVAAIGSPDTVERKLNALVSATKADELIIASDFYDNEHRLRSYGLIAEVKSRNVLNVPSTCA